MNNPIKPLKAKKRVKKTPDDKEAVVLPNGAVLEPYNELPIYGQAPPDKLNAVNSALLEVEQGRFYLTSMLIDSMCRDDRILGVLNMRLGGVLGCDKQIVATDELDPISMVIRQDIADNYNEIFPLDQLMSFLSWAILLGFSVSELEWDVTPDLKWMPKMRVWHPKNSRFEWNDLHYKLNSEEEEISLEEGNGQWVIFTPYGYRNGWLRCAGRALTGPWLSRQWALRDYSSWNEIHGLPIRAVDIPANANALDTRRITNAVANLNSNSVIRLPMLETGQKYDLRLIEATAANHTSFLDLIQETNKQIAIVLLGQSVSTDGQAGLGSNQNAGEKVRDDLKKVDSEMLVQVLRDQVLKLYVKFNYGDEYVKYTPYIKYDIAPIADGAKRATEIKTLADSLDLLTKYNVDTAALLAEHGLKLK